MSVSIPKGETREIADLHKGYRIRITGAPVVISHTRSEAVNGNGVKYPVGFSGTLGEKRGRPVYAHAPDGDATVQIDKRGFNFIDTFLDVFADASDPASPSAPSSIERNPSEGATEVNADQTQNVSSGNSQSSTVRADDGEIWELQKMRIFVQAIGSASSGDNQVTVQTEQEGIELAFGREAYNQDLEYDSGQWLQANTARTDISNFRIDSTNGLTVKYTNNTDDTKTRDREIRLQFRVILA